ncbi:uncharacterized protein RAG0_11978 [Rhynchosporium agropyri]|uniref:Uncharacterized protein n=1 Tax=Rhynchosporium agropyri TaxID=914238 RepID=A0A1E1L6M8_9HELO|nr:uncharacterized protein RAG0_11978 [Rhynchosporium agropyri]
MGNWLMLLTWALFTTMFLTRPRVKETEDR